MKMISLALASFVGMGLWYVDPAIVRAGATWLRSELAKEKNTNPSLPQYVTAQVEEGAIRRVVTTTGTLNAVANVEVSSVLSGQIARVFVDFNDLVKKGQPLAQLDQRSLEARVQEAQATADLANDNINTAKVKLDHSRIKAQQSEAQIAVLKARLDDAQVNLDKAKTLYRRKQQLVSRQAASAMELEDATMSRSSAEAKLREAEATAMVQLHNVAGTKADVRQAESEYQSALNNLAEKKAVLRLRQIDLDRSTIRSPLDGVVVGRNVNEGQTVVSEQYALPLFIVAGDLSQMQIAAKVDEADISTLGVGQQAVFKVDAYPGRQFSATVKQVRQAPEVEQNVVIYTVILSAANGDGLLLPGMTAIIDITVNQTGPILKVPLAALRFSPKLGRNAQVRQSEVKRGKPTVLWVVGKNGEPKAVSVGLGEEDGNDAAVLSGELAKGDLVIVGERNTAISWRPFGIRLGS